MVVVIVFDTFDILMVFETIVLQIVIDLGRVSAVRFGNEREDVYLDLMLFQTFQAVHDVCLTATAIDGTAVAVMKGGRAVKTDTDKEMVVMQELGPFVIEQGAIRLEDVLNDGRWWLQFVLDLDGFLVEIQPHQRWFAALPGERVFCLRAAEITCNHLAESGFRHAAVVVWIEEAFTGVETVLATEIAVASGGLDE